MPYYYQQPSTWGSTMLAVGGLFQAASSVYQGYLGYKSSKYSASLLKYEAAYAKAKGELAETHIRKQLKKIIGTQRAATAAAGIRPDVGTPLELQIESEILNDIDAKLARISGGMDSLRYTSAAGAKLIEGLSAMGKGFGQAFGYSFNTLLQLSDRRPMTTYRPPTMTTQEALG